MTQDYSSDVQTVAQAIDAVYEKKSNKKNDISGDFTNDAASFPTAKAVKTELGNYVTSTALNTILSSYVTSSEHTSDLAAKINVSDIVDNLTSTDTNKPLSAKQGKELKTLIDNKDLSGKTISIRKQTTADTGFASTYVLSQGGVDLSPKINIAKDKMVRSVSIETVGSTATTEETTAGMTTGDKYIKLVVNTEDNDGATNLILPISEVFDLQTADETTITLSAAGVFSIKSGGVDTAQLKNGAVTSDKIATAVKNTWLTSSDVQSEISAFASALAAAINPSS